MLFKTIINYTTANDLTFNPHPLYVHTKPTHKISLSSNVLPLMSFLIVTLLLKYLILNIIIFPKSENAKLR